MVKRLGLNASIGSAGSAPRSSTGVHRDPCPVDTSMKRRRDEPWHITNGCIGSACEYVNQFLLIRWFDRKYVDERNDTCVLGNRSHEKSPASEREVAPDPHILCVSGRRHSPGDPKADTGHGLQLAECKQPCETAERRLAKHSRRSRFRRASPPYLHRGRRGWPSARRSSGQLRRG